MGASSKYQYEMSWCVAISVLRTAGHSAPVGQPDHYTSKGSTGSLPITITTSRRNAATGAAKNYESYHA